MKTIIINSKKHGLKECFIDDEDFELISKYKWSLAKRKHTHYAYCGNENILMHRLIMGMPPKNILIDHDDHNGLNNQKSNIKKSTYTQNNHNRKPSGTSKYLGVCCITQKWNGKPGSPRWRASITYNGKAIRFGTFKTELEAAKAYNDGVVKYHGDRSKLNTL